MSTTYPSDMGSIELADVARVLADSSRATMCMALLDGKAWTIGELAHAAGVRPSTASEHVAVLRSSRFVSTLRQGRHSYVRIDDQQVANLIERMAAHAEHQPVRGLRPSLRARRLAFARTCYDHLAGSIAVAIRAGMLSTGLIDVTHGIAITENGRQALQEIGVKVPEDPRRELLRDCLDWTERREHLAGALPAALLRAGIDNGWLRAGPQRAIRLTPLAGEHLSRLGVEESTLRQLQDDNPT